SQASHLYPHLKIFDDFDEAKDALDPDHIHGIVQTELYAAAARNNQVLDYAQTHHISYRFVPGNSELFVGNIAVELFRSSVPVIAVHQTALIGWGRVVKRFLDVLVSLVLLVPGLPVMLVVALAVKLSDLRAPIWFKDPRLTRFGTIARIYKFRTMIPAYNGMSPEEAFTK